MQYVEEIIVIPSSDAATDFPLKISADHGHVLIESRGTYLDEKRLDVLRAALHTAWMVAARQLTEMSVNDAVG